MPEIYTLQPNTQQSPTNMNNDRYTPTPYGEPNERMYDDQPFKSSSPPIRSSHPTSESRPELYHLGQKNNDDRNDISDRRPSPAFSSNHRVSPMPYQPSNGNGPEIYHIGVNNQTHQASPTIPKTRFNDQPTYHHDEDHHPPPPPPGKVEMYSIVAENGENSPPPIRTQRNSSPPIRPAKKQQAISYDILDDNTKYTVPPKQRPFPTALHDVSSNIPYVPLTQSRATESIQRSMNKYRFAGN